jgi:hypothetical protein
MEVSGQFQAHSCSYPGVTIEWEAGRIGEKKILISGFRRGVNEVFALLGYYAT